MALITAAEARELNPSLTGTGDDTLIGTLITAVGRAFARHCGYPAASVGGNATMESATYTRYYDGPGGRELTLDVWPVTAITSIEDDVTRDFDGSTYLVTSTDYAIREGARGLVLLKATATHGAWGTGSGVIKAVYTAGYSTVPDDLKQLAKQAVKHWYDLRTSQGKASTSQGSTTISLRDEDLLPALVQQGLSRYRLPRAWL